MSQTAQPRRAATAFIFMTVLLDVLALGMVIPVLPKLLQEFSGGEYAQAAKLVGLFGTVWAAMQFIFSPVLGAASDRFGRRPIILISNFGLGLDYVLMAVAPNVAWLFVGRVFSGITAASFTTAGAYIADVTPPEKRAAGFGMLGAAFGVGFVLGPALGGLLGSMGPRLPFWVAAGLSLVNAMYGLFVLPESLPKDRRSAFSFRRANPIAALSFLRGKPGLKGLSVMSFLVQLAHVVLPSSFVLYASYRYHWEAREVGMTLAAVGVCSAIVQGGLVRHVVAALGERRTLLVGLFFGAVGFAIYGAAPTGKLFLLGIPVMSLWGLASPAGQGMMTRRVDPTEQGRLQGALSGLMGVAGLIGPTLFSQTFAWVIGDYKEWGVPGAPFFVASVLLGLALLVAATATRHEPRKAALETPAVSTAQPGAGT